MGSFSKLKWAPVALLATSFAAHAADLSSRPVYKAPTMVPLVYNWTGLYVGVSGGGAWGTSDHTFPGGTHGPMDINGGLVGGTVGYNWQASNWVFGVEGDYSWANIKGTTTGTALAPCGFAGGTTCSTSLHTLGTARGRVGYAWNNVLLYGTGGFAWGNVRAGEAGFDSGRDTHTGWTVGGGLEYGFAPNWTAKIEYLYVDLGSDVMYGTGLGVPHSVGLTANVVRAGINYRFDWGGPVVARY